MTLYSDANGYYRDSQEAIRVGKLLQEYNYAISRNPYSRLADGNKEAHALEILSGGANSSTASMAFVGC